MQKIKYLVTKKDGSTLIIEADENSFISYFNRNMVTLEVPSSNFKSRQLVAVFNIREISLIQKI